MENLIFLAIRDFAVFMVQVSFKDFPPKQKKKEFGIILDYKLIRRKNIEKRARKASVTLYSCERLFV